MTNGGAGTTLFELICAALIGAFLIVGGNNKVVERVIDWLMTIRF